MNKIIKGRRYDTNTAQLVCENWNGCANNDFNYMSETLYIKKTGEFFLHYSGGALSKYAVSTGTNNWSGSEGIIPLTEKEAEKFCSEYADGDTYEKYFEVQSDESVKLSTYVSADNLKKIKNIAIERHMTVAQLIDGIISEL